MVLVCQRQCKVVFVDEFTSAAADSDLEEERLLLTVWLKMMVAEIRAV